MQKPLALGVARVDGCPCEWLVAEFIEGPTLLETMKAAATQALPLGVQQQVADAVGRHVCAMLPLFNRDHKPSNLIIVFEPGGTPRVAVIDCVGIRGFRIDGSLRMLASLVIEAWGCGVLPRRGLLARALAAHLAAHREASGSRVRPELQSRALKTLWALVGTIVESHGDPRPLTNPLALH